MPLSEKVALADYVIQNDGTLEELSPQITRITNELQQSLGISRLVNGPVFLCVTAAFVSMLMPLLHGTHLSIYGSA